MTALGVAIAVAAVWWFSRTEKPLTTSEWLQGMRDLGLGVKFPKE